ncbi:MAG: hypothetical protein K8R58_14705 [Bacteroidales bacterium]|nr:hypothetical protein [Bacteroidales bacterium]
MKTKNEEFELTRICCNCNNFFPAELPGPSDYGICLNDKEFEPFIEEIVDNENLDCCKELIEQKKFRDDKEACENYSEVEIDDDIGVDDESVLGQIVSSSFKNGEFDKETFEQLLFEEQVLNIDFSTLPTDKYVEKLKSSDPVIIGQGINSLGGLIYQGNKTAFKDLFQYLKSLPTIKTVDDVHLRMDILHQLSNNNFRDLLTKFLIDEIYNTPSNNTTRQWFTRIFTFFTSCPKEDILEPLENMLKDKRFSYRLKQKIKDVLDEIEWRNRKY